MAITLKGVRIEELTLKRNGDSGETKIDSAVYSLISSQDKVLAKQPIGGYNALTVEPSPGTVASFRTFLESYRKDLVLTLGLEEEV